MELYESTGLCQFANHIVFTYFLLIYTLLNYMEKQIYSICNPKPRLVCATSAKWHLEKSIS